MKRLLVLIALLPLITTCTEYAYHRAPTHHIGHDKGAVQIQHCRVNNQSGKHWTRSGETLAEACHRALRACRHWRGDLHHNHQPTSCVRSYKR